MTNSVLATADAIATFHQDMLNSDIELERIQRGAPIRRHSIPQATFFIRPKSQLCAVGCACQSGRRRADGTITATPHH
jgi:hypothetical protein